MTVKTIVLMVPMKDTSTPARDHRSYVLRVNGSALALLNVALTSHKFATEIRIVLTAPTKAKDVI